MLPLNKFLLWSVIPIIYSVNALPTQPAAVTVGYSSQPWYKAWYKDELEADLKDLGFDPSLCSEWFKHIPEDHKEDYQYAMEIGELCDRLSENRADHYEAEREYKLDLKKRKKLRDSLIDMIIKLTNSSTEKIEKLTAKVFPNIGDDDTCYQQVYKTFSEACINPDVDPNMKKYRRVFANACTQDWLNVDMICQQIRATCAQSSLL